MLDKSFGSVNNIQYADSGAQDMGAELNNLISSASNGDVIVIPPGTYNQGEQVVVDKNITIRGPPFSNYRSFEARPVRLDPDGSFSTDPAFLITDNAALGHFEVHDGQHNHPACFRAHARMTLIGLRAVSGFVKGYHLHQRDSNDNLNGSFSQGIAMTGGGSTTHGVHLQSDVSSSSQNLQPNRLHIQDITDAQVGVRNEGRGGFIELVHFDPDGHSSNVAVIDDDLFNTYWIGYTEVVDAALQVTSGSGQGMAILGDIRTASGGTAVDHSGGGTTLVLRGGRLEIYHEGDRGVVLDQDSLGVDTITLPSTGAGVINAQNGVIQGLQYSAHNAVSTPNAPGSGVRIFYDTGDDTLKYIDSSGSVTTIA